MFALLHENLITKAIRASGLPEYREEAISGGGRVGAHDVGLLYMLLVGVDVLPQRLGNPGAAGMTTPDRGQATGR